MDRIHSFLRLAHRRELRRLRDDRGVTMLEFALASTVFFMTVFAIFELGIAVWRYNMLSDLAQEGARWASVRGANSAPALQANAAAVQTYVQSRANGINVTVTTTSTTTVPTVGAGTCTTTSVNPSALSAGQGLCVRVQSSYTPLTGFIPAGLINLSSSAKMVMAR